MYMYTHLIYIEDIYSCCSAAKSFLALLTPWTTAHQAPLSSTLSWNLLKLMTIELMMTSNLCCPLLILPAIFPSIRVFSNELDLHVMWPKYWSFSLSISPSNEYSGLGFFLGMIGWITFPCGSAGNESAFNGGDLDSIPGLGRCPREGKGYPLQYSGLENSMDCIVYGIAKNQI